MSCFGEIWERICGINEYEFWMFTEKKLSEDVGKWLKKENMRGPVGLER